MRRLGGTLVILAATAALAGCQPHRPVVHTQPSQVPTSISTTPVARPVFDTPVQVPVAFDPPRRYGVDGSDSGCAGSTLGRTIAHYTNQPPSGYACDPWMWHAGGVTDPAKIDIAVRYTLATCRDPWIVQATIEQIGRLPQGAECDETLYNHGHWDSYPELSGYVRALPTQAVSAATDPTRWNVLVLVYESYTGPDGRTRTMCNPAPCSDGWYQSLRTRLGYVADTVSSATDGVVTWQPTVVRARVPMVDPGPAQGFSEAAPVAATSELQGYASQNQYDSIIVVHPGYGSWSPNMAAPDIGQGGGVLTGDGNAIGTQGATYAWVIGPPPTVDWTEYYPQKTLAERILHEWLHGVEAFYRAKGFTAELPDPDSLFVPACAAGEHSIVHAAGTTACFAQEWSAADQTAYAWPGYIAFMHGDLHYRALSTSRTSFGMTAAMWATGGPRTSRYPFH